MNVKMFVKRPILSGAISVLIVLVGIIGLANLPMEQYPDIAPPTIMVSATYTGASAETVLNSVVTPLEDAINGVEDMTYMTSQSTNSGSATITVYFSVDALSGVGIICRTIVVGAERQAVGFVAREIERDSCLCFHAGADCHQHAQ